MPFFTGINPSMDSGSDYIPIDPRRRGPITPMPPMSPTVDMSSAPMLMPPGMIPQSQALATRLAAIPSAPSPTSQGLISALQGQNDWANAPTPTPYMSPADTMRQYGITDLTPPSAPNVQPAHGFWNKLGQHALGALEGIGSQRGLLPMIVGGVAGGVKPQLGANAWYNNVTMPRWEQTTAAQQGLANTRLNQVGAVGALTGINPVTGQPTFAAARDDLGRGQNELAQWEKYAPEGMPVPPDLAHRAGVPWLAGQPIPSRTKERTGELKTVVGPNGQPVLVRVDGDELSPVHWPGKTDNVYSWERTPAPSHVTVPDGSSVYQINPQTGKYELAIQGGPKATPYNTLRGDAETAVAQAHGLKSLDDAVDNPRFLAAVQQEKAADQAAAAQYGYPPASDAEIAARVARRIQQKVPARELFKSEVEVAQSQLYRNRGTGGAAPAAPGNGRAPAPGTAPQTRSKSVRMAEDELFYQQNAATATPEERTAWAQWFRQQYGRPPREK